MSTAVSTNVVVQAVGDAFVQRVGQHVPATAAQLKAEFAELSSQVGADVQAPLAQFVEQKLAAKPETAWMAEVLGPKQSAAAKDDSELRQVLSEIKTRNDGLHDKSVKKGLYLSFSAGGESIELSDVRKKLGAGEPVDLSVITYEKASGWLIAGAMMLGGSWPVLDGVDLNKIHARPKVSVASADALRATWQDAQLAD